MGESQFERKEWGKWNKEIGNPKVWFRFHPVYAGLWVKLKFRKKLTH